MKFEKSIAIAHLRFLFKASPSGIAESVAIRRMPFVNRQIGRARKNRGALNEKP